MNSVDTTWHGNDFKRLVHGNAKETIKRLGFTIERMAKENITVSIYNRRQRGNYKRTGAARASIHTEFREHEVAAYVGSDEASLRESAMTRYSQVSHFKRQGKGTQRMLRSLASTSVGSTVFYFKYLEDGFHTRNGRFIAGHHMLLRALDSLKRGLR